MAQNFIIIIKSLANIQPCKIHLAIIETNREPVC